MQEGITSAFREGYRSAYDFPSLETKRTFGKAAIRSVELGDDYFRGWYAAREARKVLVRERTEVP